MNDNFQSALNTFLNSYRRWCVAYHSNFFKEVADNSDQRNLELHTIFSNINHCVQKINSNIYSLPDALIQDLASKVTQSAGIAEKFKKENYSVAIEEKAAELLNNINSIIETYATSFNKYENEIDKILANSQSSGAIIESILTTSNEKLVNLTKRAEPLLKSLEIASYNDDFSKVAEKNLFRAKGWIVALVLALSTFLISIGCFFQSDFEFSNINNQIFNNVENLRPNTNLGLSLYYLVVVKAIIYRLVVLSVCIFFIKICYNNYKFSMHNFTLNTHKANAMKAALSIINKADDKSVQNQILHLAANAIFTHQPTGYNDKDAENATMTDSVLGKLIDKIPTGQ